ncbi:hypothetical protein [Dactylosporangium sp. NPDC051541]|uniref:hypothetical protein n=1 Tax=Dactylosporangium sp. NPDC051541 TaxID=3363977 RepID=UPI0037A9B2DD
MPVRAARAWEAITGLSGLAAPAERHAVDDLRALLPADPIVRGETVREAVTWLAANLGDPRVVAARCADLGPAVAALGVPPQRLEALAILLVDALRANPPAPPLRADEEAALRDAGRLISSWVAAGAAAAVHDPVRWSAIVTGRERRRADMAVLRLRTYLPYPCPPGLRAALAVPAVPGRHRECWVANLPEVDRAVELHVALHHDDPVGAELVERTTVGDRVDLYVPVGSPAILDGHRPLLLIADRDAVGPIQAALLTLRLAAATATAAAALAATATTTAAAASPAAAAAGTPGSSGTGTNTDTDRDRSPAAGSVTGGTDAGSAGSHAGRGVGNRADLGVGVDTERDVTVFWPSAALGDADRLAALGPAGVVVVRDRFVADGRDWSEHCAFAAGSAAFAESVAVQLVAAGVPGERTVIANIG